MQLTINPLHPVFAGEMLGADLTVPPTPELVDAVEKAMAKYGVLVLRDQFVSDEEHVRFSRAFGPLELPPGYHRTDIKRRFAREIFDASNLTFDTGELLAPDALKLRTNRDAQRFHMDSFYSPKKIKWSLLLAHEIPKGHGDTEFADRRAAYERLDEETKARIENLEVIFDVYVSRVRRGLVQPSPEKQAAFPKPRPFKIVDTAPDGRKAICVGPAVDVTGIVGMNEAEAMPLLKKLYHVACDPKYVYRHKWHQGDLVIWDNRCVLHRATEFDMVNLRRDVRRTSIDEFGPEEVTLTA